MKHLIKNLFVIFALLIGVSAFGQNYIEEPAHVKDGLYITTKAHLCDTVMRNYTYRYDSKRHIALWVAYPLNNSLIGKGSRSEDWQADPALDEKTQAILYKGFAYGSGYDRGHQIPSADRLDKEANEQTFRFTNATPQLHDFNGGIWAELEKLVRTWAKRSDTLYVVTGAIPGREMITDNDGKAINIPKAYYKCVLRRNKSKSGNTYWSACAILLPHEVYRVGNWRENMSVFKAQSLSISQLEEKTGEEFFPMLKKVTGNNYAKDIKERQPSEDSWWWR